MDDLLLFLLAAIGFGLVIDSLADSFLPIVKCWAGLKLFCGVIEILAEKDKRVDATKKN